MPLDSHDEVEMAAAFNAMQTGYQRIAGTVAQAATRIAVGAARLASSMGEALHGGLGQQSETDQAVTAINKMIADHHIAGDGQNFVGRFERSVAGRPAKPLKRSGTVIRRRRLG